MFDEALSGKVKLFRYLLNKNTCCTVIVTIELSVKSFLVISFFWWSEFHVVGKNKTTRDLDLDVLFSFVQISS